jgi:hypothetical protein
MSVTVKLQGRYKSEERIYGERDGVGNRNTAGTVPLRNTDGVRRKRSTALLSYSPDDDATSYSRN